MTTARARPARRRVDGVLLLDKPLGISSNAALQAAKRIFAAEKAGHTGTLDPLASGLLPICFGDATKFAQGLLSGRKGYVAEVRFGTATTTGDAEGAIIAELPVAFTRADLETALKGFLGTITQVPPRYAALKFEGRKFYEYARAGIEIPRAAREVEILYLAVVDWEPPVATLEITCGKGTYIRVLAEDIAFALGTCAHLGALSRTMTGPFGIERAITLDALEMLESEARDALLLPVHAPLDGTPILAVDADGAQALLEGRSTRSDATLSGRHCCFDTSGRFIGLVDVDEAGIHAVRLVRTTAPVRQ